MRLLVSTGCVVRQSTSLSSMYSLPGRKNALTIRFFLISAKPGEVGISLITLATETEFVPVEALMGLSISQLRLRTIIWLSSYLGALISGSCTLTTSFTPRRMSPCDNRSSGEKEYVTNRPHLLLLAAQYPHTHEADL